MNNHLVLVALLAWYGFFIYINSDFPWNSDIPIPIIIMKYFFGFIIIPFVAYSIFSTFTSLSGNSRNEETHTKLLIGEILDINYSNIRINNQPRFKVLVRYSNFEKEFDPIGPKINIDFRKGDNVYIWVNPDDMDDAYLDLDKSLAERESLLSGSSLL